MAQHAAAHKALEYIRSKFGRHHYFEVQRGYIQRECGGHHRFKIQHDGTRLIFKLCARGKTSVSRGHTWAASNVARREFLRMWGDFEQWQKFGPTFDWSVADRRRPTQPKPKPKPDRAAPTAADWGTHTGEPDDPPPPAALMAEPGTREPNRGRRTPVYFV